MSSGRKAKRMVALLGCGLCVLFAAPILAPHAHAQLRDERSEEAIDISAEELDLDVNAGTAEFSGKVSLRRGDLKVRCQKLEVRYAEGPSIVFAKARGRVEAELRGIRAEAPEVEIDLSRNQLELRGGVRIAQGSGFLQAASGSIDLGTSKVKLTDIKGSIPVKAAKN